ncbi:MAG: hypothetical protein EB060_03080 [Proteobacteria bacterium]|nr:hypothetical protein [Pseudomonadota bacterium]
MTSAHATAEYFKFRLMLFYLSRFKNQSRMIFVPKPPVLVWPPEPMAMTEDFAEVTQHTLTTEDGVKLIAEVLPPKYKDAPFYLCFHGNTGNWTAKLTEGTRLFGWGYRLNVLREIRASGAGFVAMHLRGYGLSAVESPSAKPSETGFNRDIAALVSWVLEQNIAEAHPIICFGESLGAYSACKAAQLMQERRVNPVQVGIVAPFFSLAQKALDIMKRMGLDTEALDTEALLKTITPKLKHRFEIGTAAASLSGKTLLTVITPEKDIVTPPYHGEKIAALATARRGEATRAIRIPSGHTDWDAKQVIEILQKQRG